MVVTSCTSVVYVKAPIYQISIVRLAILIIGTGVWRVRVVDYDVAVVDTVLCIWVDE